MFIPRHQKTYLSREMTRAMALDHPIGDPHGGPAYGERNDPVSAVISLAAMGGTYAAAGSFAAMTLVQGAVFAGAALSLVGNVTGNQTLSKIGMVVGLAGGIGSLLDIGTTAGGVGELFGLDKAAGATTGAPGAQLVQSANPAADVTTSGVSDAIVQANPVAPQPNIQATDLGPLGSSERLLTPTAAAPGAAPLPAGAPAAGTGSLSVTPSTESLLAGAPLQLRPRPRLRRRAPP